jgi:hypothetical protein
VAVAHPQGDVEQRHELTDTDLPGVAAQHVDELHADRITERLGDLGHPNRQSSIYIYLLK